jgi:prophage regulatory protein
LIDSGDKTAATLPPVGYVRLSTILGSGKQPGILPISKSAWYAGIRRGDYPSPVKISPRCSGWRVEDIQFLISLKK